MNDKRRARMFRDAGVKTSRYRVDCRKFYNWPLLHGFQMVLLDASMSYFDAGNKLDPRPEKNNPPRI